MHQRLWLVAAAAIAVSACGKKAEGQTVAVVNGEEITASELNAELASANLPSEADRKEATARVLQGLIDRRLLAGQAKKEGIDRTPEFLSRERRMREELLIGMMADRQLNTSKLPTAQEISTFQAKQSQMFANREVWRLNQLQFETPKDPRIQQEIAKTRTLDELAATLTRNKIAFQRGQNQLATNVIPAEIYARLSTLSEGEPFIVPAGNRSVASAIVAREKAPPTEAQARTEAVNLIRRQSSAEVLQQRLKDLQSSAKIEYKEGYGPPPKAPAAAPAPAKK